MGIIPEIKQYAVWPGVLAVEACQYTCSHGITPSRAILTSAPQPDGGDTPAQYGDLLFSDGQRAVVIKGCKVDRVSSDRGPRGITWTLEILDRRWRWKPPGSNGFGGISGTYNSLDNRAKLVPWKIQSPTELAALCFAALGERNYRTRLPVGLPSAIGKNLDRYLAVGVNFPQTSTNPPTVWDYTPPAEALARLCDLYGCLICYQPISDRFVVTQQGEGRDLPDYPFECESPGIDLPELPVAVGVAGAPIRFQMRYKLEPVARESDDSFVPIDDVSYAPVGAAKVQISQVRYLAGLPQNLFVTFSYTDPVTGEVVEKFCHETNPGSSVAVRFATIIACMSNNPKIAAFVTFTTTATTLVFTGNIPGRTFSLSAEGYDPAFPTTTLFQAELIQAPLAPNRKWTVTDPPNFSNATPTDRLSYQEAMQRARSSIFRAFRIMNVDPHTGQPPLVVPGYGAIKRRQQCILQPTKVEQVKPQPRIAGGVNKGGGIIPNIPGQGILPEFYNGYSRDQAATVTGSVYSLLFNVNWFAQVGGNQIANPVGVNTGRFDRVFIDIESIDPVEQIVWFSDYVYRIDMGADGGLIGYPVLVLETACVLEDNATNGLVRYTRTRNVKGGVAPIEWLSREDCQVGVIGKYEVGDRLVGHSTQEQKDADGRADYYVIGRAAKYVTTEGGSRQYVGIWPIEPDGRIQQVTWSVGGGATTVASANTEHSTVIPPYPARRLRENLQPDAAAAAANAAEREWVDKLRPKPPGGLR